MKVSIIGQGYVGLTISAFAGAHHTVVGFDKSQVVVDRLNKGISHIEGVESSAIAGLLAKGTYKATTNAADIAGSDIVVIAVPTPLDSKRSPDLSYIDSACKVIAENLDKPALIINESTSFPGTIRNFIKPTIEKHSRVVLAHEYAISPERVDPGRVEWNQKNTPRLFSGLTPEATRRTREFYSTFCDQLVEVSSPEVAEAAKLFENTFRQVNIALVNELAQISHALGIDVRETLDAANTKPYGFMKFSPSAGVGGHCIPVDPYYLSWKARAYDFQTKFIELAADTNLGMADYVCLRVSRFLNRREKTLNGAKVLALGVAFKEGVSDTRNSRAVQVIKLLEAEGAIVDYADPMVPSITISGRGGQPGTYTSTGMMRSIPGSDA